MLGTLLYTVLSKPGSIVDNKVEAISTSTTYVLVTF